MTLRKAGEQLFVEGPLHLAGKLGKQSQKPHSLCHFVAAEQTWC